MNKQNNVLQDEYKKVSKMPKVAGEGSCSEDGAASHMPYEREELLMSLV